MTPFDKYHELAARLLGKEDFPLPLPKMDRDYPHNVGLLSDAEESELTAKVLNNTTGMTLDGWKKLGLEQRVPWLQVAVDNLGLAGGNRQESESEIWSSLRDRAAADHLVVDADEVAIWPTGLLEQLVHEGVLSPSDPARSVVCDACGEDHAEEVQYIKSPPNSNLRAYITCPANGRVFVPLARLRRWGISREKILEGFDKAETEPNFGLPPGVTTEVTYTTEFLPTPSADDAKGLRNAAEYCRAYAAKLGDARAKWWWMQAIVFDQSAGEAEAKTPPVTKTKQRSPGKVDEPLNQREQNVLVALLEFKAFDSDTRKSTSEIAPKALGPNADPNALKSVMSKLKKGKFIQSKPGSGGGYWLTEKGRNRAEKLQCD